jgi:hypothetical protein
MKFVPLLLPGHLRILTSPKHSWQNLWNRQYYRL